MGDCAINITPNEEELVEIAHETANCARIFGLEPEVAFLSYSTFGSGSGETVDKMRNAAEMTKKAYPETKMRIVFHNVPKDWFSSNLYHWLRS